VRVAEERPTSVYERSVPTAGLRWKMAGNAAYAAVMTAALALLGNARALVSMPL